VSATPEAPTAPRRRRGLWLTLTLLTLLALAAAATSYVMWALEAPSEVATPIEVEILRGSGAARIATELYEAGLVRDARVFLLLLRYEGIDRRIGEGLYDLHTGMDARTLAATLARGGRPRTVRVVLPEGSRLSDVATRLEAAGIAPLEAGLARLRSSDGVSLPTEVAVETLEGYLFPAAYDVPIGEGLDAVVARMVRRFEQELDAATRAALDAVDLDVHAWVTLASMVQAEAANDAEMPIIAGVFLNRLEIGMPLQSDPTVAYGLGKDLPQLDFPAGDFAVDHPWNTYTRPGLPLGPIGNPGRAALDAVLAPERTNADGRRWFYFLHGRSPDGPVFRPNLDYDGHLRDVARYLR